MRIIAIANQKGGVGKTPITVNLGFALARAGYNILFVDFDPQGSLSEYFLADQADIQDITVYNALSDLQRIDPLMITKHIALLPAHDELSGAELELPGKVHGQKRLARMLRLYQADYDFCLIDCPPSLGILTINALASAHQVLIPVKTEMSAFRALKRIKNTIKDIQESDLNGGLTVWGYSRPSTPSPKPIIRMFCKRSTISMVRRSMKKSLGIRPNIMMPPPSRPM
jgi:chromosome partitioning protein